MACQVGGGASLSCMDVAVSLGLYLADKNTGSFSDMFLTFSSTPRIEVLTGNIVEKVNQMMDADWGMSTNLHGAFDEILRVAQASNVPEAEMPKYVLILSDMQFNGCVRNNDSAMEMIERKFEAAGYEVPKVVFWNISNGRNEQAPVTFDKEGTALVSGFSPAITKSILRAENFTPRDIMLDTINAPRYDVFG